MGGQFCLDFVAVKFIFVRYFKSFTCGKRERERGREREREIERERKREREGERRVEILIDLFECSVMADN